MYKVLRNLVLEYIGDEEWIYRNFGILTPYLYSINYRPKQKYYDKKLSLIENVMYTHLKNYDLFYEPKALDFETLQSIVTLHNDDGDRGCYEVINIESKKAVYKYIEDIINDEMEYGEIHPRDYPIGYLTTGILYDENWEYLTNNDINKFCISCGIPLIKIKIVKNYRKSKYYF